MSFPSPSSRSKKSLNLSIIDIICIVGSPFLSLWLRDPNYLMQLNPSFLITPFFLYIIITIFVTITVFILFRVHEKINLFFNSQDALLILLSILFSTLLSIVFMFYYNRLESVPRSVPIINALLLTFGLFGYRLVAKALYEKYSVRYKKLWYGIEKIRNTRKIIIIGLDQFSLSAIRLLQKQTPISTQVVAAFSIKGKFNKKRISNVEVFSNLIDLEAVINEYRVHGVDVNEIWMSCCSSYLTEDMIKFIIDSARSQSIDVKYISEALNIKTEQNPHTDIGFLKDDEISILGDKIYYLIFKRIYDISISLFLAVLLLPVLFIVCSVIYWNIGMPIIFWQDRIGRGGVPFRLYKIRTLSQPIDRNGFILPDEKRLNSIRSAIRKFRLDEIPQLYNVIIGDMSLIGPRPLLNKDQPDDSIIRLSVRPGITGWAQVNGGELLNIHDKNLLDVWYVYHMSFWLECKIVLKTISVLIKGVYVNEDILTKIRQCREISDLINFRSTLAGKNQSWSDIDN